MKIKSFFFPFFLVLSLLNFSYAFANETEIKNQKDGEDKTILLAILARNKGHVLKRYLNCIDELDYDKKLITLYINTNNNQDDTANMLADWVEKNRSKYRDVIFKNHHLKGVEKTGPHDWTPKRFKILAKIREESLKKTKELQCDYYFVVDCDNFIEPYTLKTLISKKKPIIAPMLLPIPEKGDVYSNFYCGVTDDGYYVKTDIYFDYLDSKIRGTFNVPVVHCTYLIDANVIDRLSYIDGTNDYEFVIFSRIARKNGIDQYICNEKYFGCLVHFFDNVSLEEEAEAIRRWEAKK